MNKEDKNNLPFDLSHVKDAINISTLKNIIYFSGGIIVFLLGVLLYGIFLNMTEDSLIERLNKLGISTIQKPLIVVDRKAYTLSLYDDTIMVKVYRVNFGQNISDPKIFAHDNATPVGEYEVTGINHSHKYYKFIRLNYPNVNDAANALRKGMISQKEYDDIKFQNYYGGGPAYNNTLGGNIGIHGIGEYNGIFKNLPFNFNWTDGSIALNNENIDELLTVISKGTKIVIQ